MSIVYDHPRYSVDHYVLQHGIEPNLCAGLIDYAKNHREQGSFLMAALANDFIEAVCRASPESLACIRGVATFIHNELPGACHGSPEKVRAWLAKSDGIPY